jgi:mannosyltransferase
MRGAVRVERAEVPFERGQRLARELAGSPTTAPIALMALVALLSLVCLSCESLWVDEASSYWISQLRGENLYNIGFSYDAAMPLYYAALHLWLAFGHSEFAIRSLSVVCAIASVGALYGLGHELFGRRAAFFAGLLFAVAAPTIRYAQEARGYALVILLSICAVWSFVRAVRRGGPLHWAVFGATCLAAILTQTQAAMLLPALGASILIGRDRARHAWLALGLVLIGSLPFLLRAAGRFASAQLPDIGHLFSRLLDPTSSGAVYGMVGLATGIVGAVMISRRTRWVTQHGFALALVGGWAVFPIVLQWMVSSSLSLHAPRYAAVSLPPVMLLLGIAIAALSPRAVRLALAGGLAVVSLVSVFNVVTGTQKEDWRGVVAFVAQRSEVGDGIVFFAPGVAPAFSYYEADHNTMPAHVYPYEGWRTTEWDKPQEPPLEETINASGDSFRGRRRIWFVRSHFAPTSPDDLRRRDYPLLLELLRRDYRRVDIPDDGSTGISVFLYERKPNA